MAKVEMVMPKMGESIMEATILTWLKKEGDVVEADESVLEVATDKVDTEVPSTHGGVIEKILANEGDVVEVGKPIAIISTEAEVEVSADPTPVVEDEIIPETVVEAVAEPIISHSNGSNGAGDIPRSSGGRFYSPLVRNIAKEENISVAELESVPGSGAEGRVTKKDILAYISTRSGGAVAPQPQQPQAQPSVAASAPMVQTPSVPAVISGGDEIIEMDRMRKMIAERMVDSKRTSPHVTSFVEADVTGVVDWRKRNKDAFKAREGQSLTFTPIFVDAIVKAIKDFPMINIQVDGTKIIKKKDINIGVAVALPSGNLIVPVIHNADQYNLVGLAKKVNDLAFRARENKLTPDELSGGTYTVSNVGSFGNVMGTPIIMQPQVAIMATGAIVKKPAVIETPNGDFIGIRHKMFLSHSYDHRVVDGALGGMMVRKVADYLEQFDTEQAL